jgi:tetratricopeptide (TPR) repeat protein
MDLRGLEMALDSQASKARALIPAMLNNAAWDLHDAGRYHQAMELFKEALEAWSARDKPVQIQIAKWSVARCSRSLGRHADALEILYAFADEHQAAGTVDGYVFEDLAENLAVLGEREEAALYFRLAHGELSKDAWLAENEPARLMRLESLGKAAEE